MIVVGGGDAGAPVVAKAVVVARVVMIVVGGGVVGAPVVAEADAGAAVVGEAVVVQRGTESRRRGSNMIFVPITSGYQRVNHSSGTCAQA